MRWLKVDFGIRSVRPAAVTPPAVNDLHKVEEVIQIQHATPHRPIHRTLSCNFGDFSADSPAARSVADRRSVLGAGMTIVGVAPSHKFLEKNPMSNPTHIY